MTKHTVPPILYKDPLADFDVPVSPPAEEKVTAKKTKPKIEDEYSAPVGINVKLPPNLHKKYKKFCVDKGISFQEHLLEKIKEAIES